jgi:hypothetical protein
LDHHGRIGDGLHTTTAAAIYLATGNVERQVSSQGSPSANAGSLAIGVALGEYDFFNSLGIYVGPGDQLGDYLGCKIFSIKWLETAKEATDGCPDR